VISSISTVLVSSFATHNGSVLFRVAKRIGRESLQTRAGLLAADLQQLQTIFDANRGFLTAAHPYPHAAFPGHSHEIVLQQLLRKKAEPTVEDWVEDNLNPNRVVKWDNGRDTGLKEDEQMELWAFAKPTSAQTAGHMYSSGAFDYEYTLAEKETGVDSVVTGLKRKLNKNMENDEDDDMDDEDEEMGDTTVEDVMPGVKPASDPFGDMKGIDQSKPALAVEVWLKFMSVMAMPKA
jgi:mediator of RNA polymerase II transcription subunit 8